MLLHSVISAGTYLAAKRALGELSPFEVALVRFTLSGSIFALVLWRGRLRVERRDLRALIALGFVAIPLNQGLFLAGMAWTTPAHGSLLYALTPIFVFLIARAKLGERATPLKLGGIALAFAGVVLVLVGRGSMALDGSRRMVLGDLLVLLAVIAWAVFATAGKVYTERYGPVAFTGTAVAIGSLLYLPVGLAASDLHRLQALSAGGWASLGYLAVVTSVLAYLLYYWALAREEASRVAVWSNLQPVLTALLSWALTGERLTGPFLAGGVMVLAGVVLTERG